MQTFERDYALLVTKVLNYGAPRETRAGEALSLFGEVLRINIDSRIAVPIIQGRKMYTKGILGEFKTFMAMAQSADPDLAVSEDLFKVNGCNYWGQWADEDGYLSLDYGAQWNAGGQLLHVVNCLVDRRLRTDRRMLIDAWVPENVHGGKLSLPCCHYAYQFYVRDNTYLDILWHQRSTDVMVGLPSDILLAWLWLTWLCQLTTDLIPGEITMTLGDTHVYSKHVENARVYTDRVLQQKDLIYKSKPWATYDGHTGTLWGFDPARINIHADCLGKLSFEVLG